MDIRTATEQYADALLFAAEVTDAVTRPGHGDHGAKRLRDPYAAELLRHQSNWSWCDNRQDVDLAATGALRATVDYVARRHALSMLSVTGTAAELWPDAAARLELLGDALRFAATTAEDAWGFELQPLLVDWIRDRLNVLLAPPGDSPLEFEARVRRAVVITHRYREACHELFGDRHWTGRETRWWCPDDDLAARAPFHNLGHGPAVPVYVLRITSGGAEFTITTGYHAPTVTHSLAGLAVPASLAGDPIHLSALRDALRSLARPMS